MNANHGRMSVPRASMKVIASILVVSMFLLASVAVIAPASTGEVKNDAKELDTLIVTDKEAKSDYWKDGTDYTFTSGKEPVLTLKGGEYTSKANTLINVTCDKVKIVVETGKVFSVNFTTPGSTAIQAIKELKLFGDGKFVIEGLSTGYFAKAQKIEIGEAKATGEANLGATVVAPTILTDGRIVAEKNGNEQPETNPDEGNVIVKGGTLVITNTADVFDAITATAVKLNNGGFLIIDCKGTGVSGELKMEGEAGTVSIKAGICVNGKFDPPKTAETNPVKNIYVHLISISDGGKAISQDIDKKEYTALVYANGAWSKATEKKISAGAKGVLIGVETTSTVAVSSANPEMGSAEAKRFVDWKEGGESKYFINEPILITATANEGYQFLKWNDVSDENPRYVTIAKDSSYSYVANFCIKIPEQRDIEVDASETGTADIKVTDDTRTIIVDFAQGSYVYINDVSKLKGHEVTISLQKQSVGDKFDFEAKFKDTGKEIETPIMVTLPYDKTMGGSPTAYYYPDVGPAVKMSSMIDETNGTVSFITTHNSVYGVEYVSDEPTVVSTDNSWVPIVVIMVFALLAIIVVAWKKD